MSFVLREIFKCRTHLMLIKYWANATASGLPLIVIVLSVFPPSRSSQFEMRIMAPEIWRISAILVPPFPMMHPIKSFGTVISCCCVLVCVLAVERNWEPASAARAVKKRHRGLAFELFFYFAKFCAHKAHVLWLEPSILTTLKTFVVFFFCILNLVITVIDTCLIQSTSICRNRSC